MSDLGGGAVEGSGGRSRAPGCEGLGAGAEPGGQAPGHRSGQCGARGLEPGPGREAPGGLRLREGPLRLLGCRWRECGNVGCWREQCPVSGHVDSTR